eukprot:453800_1
MSLTTRNRIYRHKTNHPLDVTYRSRTIPEMVTRKPHRPLIPFFQFSGDRRAKLKEDNPNLNLTEMQKLLRTEWKNLDAQDKKKYEEEFEIRKEEYNKRVKKYNKRVKKRGKNLDTQLKKYNKRVKKRGKNLDTQLKKYNKRVKNK